MANPKLSVEIEADIKGMEAALSRADSLLKQHQNNYKNVQAAISQNTQRSNQLQKSLQNLNNQFKAGAISEGQFAKESDRLSAELREISNETSDYQRELRRLDSEMDRVAQSTRNYQKAAQSTTRATGQQAKATQQMARTTKANAVPAMTSFSQVVQDAPYGIQGVANNIQMLTQQMGYLSAQAGGTRGALKAMVGTLMGPTGILLGVSLVTTALVTYGDRLFDTTSATDELNKATKDLIGSAQSEITTLKTLLGVAQDEEQSKENRQRAINKINDMYGSYLGNLDLESVNTDKVTTSVNNLTKALIRQAKIRGVQDLISEKAAEIAEAEAEAYADAQEKIADIRNASARSRREQDPRLAPQGDEAERIDSILSNVRNKMEENITQNALAEAGKDAKKEFGDLERMLESLIGEDIELEGVFTDVSVGGAGVDSAQKLLKDLGIDEVELQAELDADRMAVDIEEINSIIDENAERWNKTLNDAFTLYNTTAIEDKVAEVSLDFRMNQAEEKFKSLTDTAKESEEEISKVGKSIERTFEGMISGMVNSLIRGEFEVEDFVKNIASSLASIAITSIFTGGGGLFAGLFSNGGVVPQAGYAGSFSTGGVVPGSSNIGDKLWARVNSGEIIFNKNQQKLLYSALNTPQAVPMMNEGAIPITGSTRIDGQDLIVVYERAEKRLGRTT